MSKHVLIIFAIAGLLGQGALAQGTCDSVFAKKAAAPASPANRVDDALSLLMPMFSGKSVNAAMGADHILNEINVRLTAAGKAGESAVENMAAPISKEPLDQYSNSVKALKTSIDKKAGGLFKGRKEKKILRDVRAGLEAMQDNAKKADELVETLNSQIKDLRQRQMDVDTWTEAIQGEVDFLQGLTHRLKVESQSSGSASFVANFGEEILPRFIQKMNLMAGHLTVAASMAHQLKLEVSNRQSILDDVMGLRMVQPALVQKATERLSAEIKAEEQRLEQAAQQEINCIRGDLCIGEVVVGWNTAVQKITTGGTDRDVIVGKFDENTYIIHDRKGKAIKYSREYIARSARGLTSEGLTVGDRVICRDGNQWRIVGIFPNGDFLIKYLKKAIFGVRIAKNQFVRVPRSEITRFGRE